MKKNTFFNIIMIVISYSVTLGAGLLGGWYLCQKGFTETDLLWKYQYQKLPIAEQKKVEKIVATGKSPSIEEFYLIPNALWHHSLNPCRQDNEINSQGFRNPEMSVEELTKRPLIICAGDSTTENWQRPMADSYPVLLQELLKNDSPTPEPVVLNAGVGSMTSNLVGNLILNRLIHFRPQIVIVKAGFNDLFALCHQPITTNDYTGYFLKPFSQPLLDQSIIEAAKINYRGKVQLAAHIAMVQNAAHGWNINSLAGVNLDRNIGNFRLLKEHLLAIVGMLKSNGIKPVLLDLPIPLDSPERFQRVGGREFFIRYVALVNQILEEVSREQAVPLVKVQPLVKADDFWDHAHLERSGNLKTAQALRGTILNLLNP